MNARRIARLFVLAVLAFLIGWVFGWSVGAAHGDDLAAAVRRSHPTVERVDEHAAAATAAAYTYAGITITPEILLSIAWVESRYVVTAVSRLECSGDDCLRRTGDWPRPFPPRFRPPFFCGYLQQRATSERACRAMAADLVASYAGAAAHLRDWIRFCAADREARRHDRLRCALAGYNGGVAAARAGRKRYAYTVLSRARRLVERWPLPPRRPST